MDLIEQIEHLEKPEREPAAPNKDGFFADIDDKVSLKLTLERLLSKSGGKSEAFDRKRASPWRRKHLSRIT